MTKNRVLSSLLLLAAGAAIALASLYPLAANQHPAAAAQSAASSATATSRASAKLYVVPDLAERVAKFKLVHMPFNSAGLSAREKEMVAKLVDASGLLDCIYWRQNDPQGLKLYLSLAQSKDPEDLLLRRYLKINGSRFDLIDDDKPFVGTEPMPPGRGFYPAGMTKDKFDAYVAAHPEQKASLYAPFSVVRNKPQSGGSELIAIPYHVEFREFLEPMAKNLREAAAMSNDPAFAKFLRLRADALLTDDYFASDIAWLDLQNPKFDVVFAPYEVYDDSLLGVKTTYGASVMIRNDAESEKLALYQKYVPDLQEALPLPAADLPSKRGKQSPMEVVDSPYRAGDLLHGYQAVADNLPNDPRIHEEKGSKKIFWKNFMDARVNYIILPLAQRTMRSDQAAMASGEGYLADTIMHEISHGLGPAFAHTAQGKVQINEAIGSSYSALEESKADVVGEFCYGWLIDHGVLPKERRNITYASYVAGIFRTVRFGVAEAHGAGEIMQFNYYVEQGAITRDPGTGFYVIDFEKMPAAIASLAKELLEQEDTGDRARTDAWFKKYGGMPPELSALLAKTSDIPVDIDPEFDFHPVLK
ncbi:MAG: hypothetical protein WCC97_12490 [Candidatus Acidiferrales bacterium]